MKASPAPQPLLSFGQCLRRVLEEKKLSASALARMMGMKSRNGLFRILEDGSSPAAQMAFLDKLMDSLTLTPEQIAALRQALEVSRVGKEGYRSNQELRRLFVDMRSDVQSEPLRLIRSNGERGDFDAQLRAYAQGREVSIAITGCCDRRIFEAIARQLMGTGCKVNIGHFFYTGGDEIIRVVSAVQPVLYSSCYEGYCIDPGCFSSEREQLYRTNTMVVRFVDAQGQTRVHMLSLYERGRLLLIEQISKDSMNLFVEMMRADKARLHPIKSTFDVQHSPEDYLRFTEDYRKLEHGRSIYTVKLDVPINFIHPDTLVASVMDGFRESGFAQDEGLSALVQQFYDIQLRRFNNFFAKRRPTHTIFSQEAMLEFARTGAQSDHFFAQRPYTPQERVSILAHLRTQTEVNPYFNIYFFKPTFIPPRAEFGLYDGAGTLISKPDTHYELDGDHAQALVTQGSFCEKYKEFFMNDLLVNHVLSHEKTLAVLDALIEVARGQM